MLRAVGRMCTLPFRLLGVQGLNFRPAPPALDPEHEVTGPARGAEAWRAQGRPGQLGCVPCRERGWGCLTCPVPWCPCAEIEADLLEQLHDCI